MKHATDAGNNQPIVQYAAFSEHTVPVILRIL